MSSEQNKMIQSQQHNIAIIGMASIFPQAATLREYWDNILNKVDAIIDIPNSHWGIEDYYDPDPSAPDKVYSKRGGFIPEIDFDPLEYGLPPNILEITDTSQLLSLVVAKDTLLDAGYLNAAEAVRERTGIVLGVGGGQKLIGPLNARLQYPVWEKVLKACGIAEDETQTIIEKIKLAYVKWEENAFPGALGNVIAGRIANRFDLGGINSVVDAACASSLSALNMAVNELALGHADMMLTGGVDTDNSIFMYMCFSKTPAFSRGNQSRPFDSNSDGMMVGEGLGMVALKRLEDAERDGDRIYAVIKSIGTSSDGRYKSIYAPRTEGQERALRRAYERAGFSPASVGLIEAHGTGTVAGDITESQTLVRYLSQETSQKQAIALGSVKSQIGHTKAAAGAAGLIKIALALHHQVLPPMINIDQPNPKLNLDDSPLYLNTEARPWLQPDDGTPRRAAVSSFGFGGTNFHAVLEEYTGKPKTAYRLNSTPQLVLLAADNPAALQALCETHLISLQSDDAYFNELVRAASTPPLNAARVGFIAQSAVEARDLLQVIIETLTSKPQAEEWQHPKGIYYRKTGLDLTGKIVALFSGQGSQYLNMGRELALNFPPLRETYQAMDALFARDSADQGLSSVVFPPPPFTDAQAEQLQHTEYAQPAIGAFSAGLYQLLRDAGFKADFAAGHSFGELTALWAAGTLNDTDYYALVRARGQAMAPQNTPNFDAGTMLAVTGKVADLAKEIEAFPGVVMANLNSPKQVVLAGPKQMIGAAQQALKDKGYNVVSLPVSAAFHTPLVAHAQRPFAEAIQHTTFQPPTIPVYSNVTGDAYPSDPAAIQQQLSRHLLNSVQFQREIENIHAAGGYLFVEFGPRNVLTNLVKDILNGKPHLAIALNANRQKNSDHQLRDAVVQLCVLGLPLMAFDPYRSLPQVSGETKRKGMNVRLNGANYVSDKTRAAFTEALNDGFQVAISTPVAAVPEVTPQPVPQQLTALDVLERSLSHFEVQQREMLNVHEQYLNHQTEYFRLFYQLTQQQQALIASHSLSPGTVEEMTRNLTALHDHQAETLRIHEQYLHQQSEGLQSFLSLIREQYLAMGSTATMPLPKQAAPVVPPPAPLPTPSVPAPSVPVAAVPVPVTTNGSRAEVNQLVDVPTAPAPSIPVAAIPVSVTTNGSGAEVNHLADALLTIVSEKTGYPAEMLELEMDMEADLGIDSIKRVEILGAMRAQFPELPTFKAEELAELRTLQQIVDYMRAQVGSDTNTVLPASPPPAVEAPSAPATVPAPHMPAAAVPVPVTTNGSGAEVNQLADALLAIVSEKTGYPAEMLELEMDMEADLGIDSIKRVEILGAMRAQFPELPTFKAEELAELRTLQQIVDYMRAQVADPEVQPGRFFKVAWDIPRSTTALKYLPRPDFLDFDVLEDGVCVITDDGSPLTASLVHEMKTKGWQVVVLSFPATLFPPSSAFDVRQIRLPDWSEVQLKAAVDLISSQYGSIQAFIHLNPTSQRFVRNGDIFLEQEKMIIKAIFLLAKYLKPALTAPAGRRSFMTITRLDGSLGIDPKTHLGAIASGLFGLTKSLNLEWEKVHCRAVDLAPDITTAEAVRHIVAELHDPNRFVVEAAYGPAGRVTLVAQQGTTN